MSEATATRIDFESAGRTGWLGFDLEDEETNTGKITAWPVMSDDHEREFRRQLKGNPERWRKIGGADVPEDPEHHFDLLDQILMDMTDKFADFGIVVRPRRSPVQDGDDWR